MVDTVHFTLHNLHLYPLTFKKFFNIYERSNTITRTFINESSGEITQADFTNNMVFGDSGKFMPVTFSSVVHQPSSHYSISYRFVPSKNSLVFNVSAPKEAFGSNVFQLLPAVGSGSWECYGKLMDWFRQFFQRYMPEVIDFHDVELRRIDFCYNQFFKSESDAMSYLSDQKKFLPDYDRLNNNKSVPYATGLVYRNKGFSFKIYHKGDEFRKNDYKEIMRLGNPGNLNLNELQNAANRILRYEVTYRPWYVSYLVGMFFFPFDTSEFNARYLNNPVVKLLEYCKSAGLIDLVMIFKQRTKRIFLAAEASIKNPSVVLNDLIIPFDKDIFDLLYNHFWNRVKDFQVAPSLSYQMVKDKIKQYEDRQAIMKQYKTDKRSGMDKSRVMMLATLMKYGSIYEMKNHVSKDVWYRIKKDIALLGIDMRAGEMNVIKPALDFEEYRQFVTRSGKWVF